MKFPLKAALFTIGLGMALGVTFELAYAALNRHFNLPIQATVTVSVASPKDTADLDGNGVVDRADLQIVAANFKTGHAGGDVDLNGVVNILDLAYIARYFGGTPPEPTPTPQPATPTPQRATPTPEPVPLQAAIQGFSHLNLNIQVGSRVFWTNLDGSSHTSTSGQSPTQDGIWDTGVMGQGQSSAPIAFDTPGTFPYFCLIHPFMIATVTVTQ